MRVDREEFLRKQFAGSPHLGTILADGPQAVFSVESLRLEADTVIENSTAKTSAASFAAGLPGNPAARFALGGADVAPYVGFAPTAVSRLVWCRAV